MDSMNVYAYACVGKGGGEPWAAWRQVSAGGCRHALRGVAVGRCEEGGCGLSGLRWPFGLAGKERGFLDAPPVA